MNLFTKILLIVLIIASILNVYAIDWNLGLFHEENTFFLLGFSAGIIAIMLIFIFNALKKINK